MTAAPARQRLRAGDRERDQTANRLRDAHVEGRLDLAELDDRLEQALRATYLDQLPILVADLPAPETRPPAPARPRRHGQHRLPLLLVALVVVAVVVAVTDFPPFVLFWLAIAWFWWGRWHRWHRVPTRRWR